MAQETTLRLLTGEDGSHQLVIEHKSDRDALPHEHEEDHRDIANSVLEGGLKGGGIKVSREQEDDGKRRNPEQPQKVQKRQEVKA